MQPNQLILAEEFCSHHKIEISFIQSLQQFGLIEVTSVNETFYIPQNQLQKLEQILRLHYELNINLEGVDAIAHVTERIRQLQNEIQRLRNRLTFYETVQ